jgi:uncharacterized protein YkwD
MLFRGMVVTGAMAVALAAPSVAQAQCANQDASFTSISATAAAASVECLVNEERAAAGRGTLAHNGKLTRIAAGHADYIGFSNNFSHIDDEGDNPTDRADNVGYNWKRLGETIVIASTAREAVDRWLSESRHRGIMLRSKFRDIGVGAAGSGDFPDAAVFVLDVGVRR